MFAIFAGLTLLAAPLAEPSVRIEMGDDGARYRMVIQAPHALSFEAHLLDKPSGSLAPGIMAIEVRDRSGKRVRCPTGDPGEGDGLYRSAIMSSTLFQLKAPGPMVKVSSRFASEWYAAEALFAGFEHCADQPDKRQWASYRIHVGLRTSAGPLTHVTDWMPTRTPIF